MPRAPGFKGYAENNLRRHLSWRRRGAAAALALASCLALAAAAQVPPPVAEALKRAGVPPEQAAVLVQEIGAARPWIQQNAERALNPGSVMKLVVTYAALERLGPAYRWRTEVYLEPRPGPGAPGPALHVKGFGDPKLTVESFWLLLRALRERGLKDLRGDLVLDRSYFDAPAHDPGAFDAEPFRVYNTGPDALLVNFKSVRFQIVPGAADKVRIFPLPNPRGLEIVNTLRNIDGPCGNWRDAILADFRPVPGGLRAVFAGPYPKSCGEQPWQASLFPPNDYVGGVFRQLWEELGGSWSGTVRDGAVPAGTPLLYTHESPPLAEIVRDINKYSNNVMARQLYLTLGAAGNGAPARSDAAYQAVRAALAARGLDMPELVIENGSGLSRVERISARNLLRLLLSAYAGPNMADFVASLPLVAVDGTMRRRLNGSAVSGQAQVKTGTLADTRALAGYVLDRNAVRHVVVMLINHPAASGSAAAQDALLSWVYNRGLRE